MDNIIELYDGSVVSPGDPVTWAGSGRNGKAIGHVTAIHKPHGPWVDHQVRVRMEIGSGSGKVECYKPHEIQLARVG